MIEPWRQRLGPGLCELIAELGACPAGVEQITRQRSNVDVRGSFRVALADGRTIKARRFDSAAKAAAARALRAGLDMAFLPRVIGQRGDGMLEAWIEGRVLCARHITLDECTEAGRMLGALHAAGAGDGDPADGMPLSAAGWINRVGEHLRLLSAAGVVTGERAARIEQAAMSCVPARVTIGVVHRDWCPENLVIDGAPGSGRMHCIDNGTLTVGVIEEDLARLRHRWPMSDVQQAAFAAGYARHRDAAGLNEPGLFWRIAVVVGAARYRLPDAAEAAAVLEPLDAALDAAAAAVTQTLPAAPW